MNELAEIHARDVEGERLALTLSARVDPDRRGTQNAITADEHHFRRGGLYLAAKCARSVQCGVDVPVDQCDLRLHRASRQQ